MIYDSSQFLLSQTLPSYHKNKGNKDERLPHSKRVKLHFSYLLFIARRYVTLENSPKKIRALIG